MKKGLLFALLSLAVLNGRAAGTNLYFKTFVYLPTVNEFNSSNTWAYGDYKGSYLPGTDDTLYTLFYVTDLWTTRDWRIYFSESITNYKVIARAPLYGHHATFDLDQKTWSLLNDYALLGGRGGRIVLTNGFLNVSNKLSNTVSSTGRRSTSPVLSPVARGRNRRSTTPFAVIRRMFTRRCRRAGRRTS